MLKHWTAGIMVLLLVCSALLEAQPARGYAWRVRLTGKRQYEIPGVVSIDGAKIIGTPQAVVEPTTIRVLSSPRGPLTIVRPGAPLIGHPVNVTSDAISLLVKGQDTPMTIPLDSLSLIERSNGSGRRHLVRGILVGAGVFYGTGWIMFTSCGFACDESGFAIATFGAGTVAGVLAGWGREHWRPVTSTDLIQSSIGAAATGR